MDIIDEREVTGIQSESSLLRSMENLPRQRHRILLER